MTLYYYLLIIYSELKGPVNEKLVDLAFSSLRSKYLLQWLIKIGSTSVHVNKEKTIIQTKLTVNVFYVFWISPIFIYSLEDLSKKTGYSPLKQWILLPKVRSAAG